MLGYRGHFATKSRRYSTTMRALRAARRNWKRRQHPTATAATRPSSPSPTCDGTDEAGAPPATRSSHCLLPLVPVSIAVSLARR
jgi:hypothetical protein